MQILEALNTQGQDYIIGTGDIPDTWQYQHAMPVSAKRFHIYALMANPAQEMGSFRFTFVRSMNAAVGAPQWLLWRNQKLGETEYLRGIYKCLQWSLEFYHSLEDGDDGKIETKESE
ncbi:MAG: hypothetical protein JKX99_07585 [Robiginitomaculum sp.]|nr:hypothetical protein [Robiginitomaculum sp.]